MKVITITDREIKCLSELIESGLNECHERKKSHKVASELFSMLNMMIDEGDLTEENKSLKNECSEMKDKALEKIATDYECLSSLKSKIQALPTSN